MTTSPVSFVNDDLVERVRANLARVVQRIASTGRDPREIRVVGVTKTFDARYVRAAGLVGLGALGENYVEELCQKRVEVGEGPTWHYLGALQSNKIHRITECADVICGVSRIKELERIAKYGHDRVLYLQVDFTRAAGRNGAPPEDVENLVERARTLGLEIRGLMTVGPANPEGAREAFRAATSLANDLGLVERSMGMSDDLEIACELGSTEVRIGRALFGARNATSALT
ncbi:MAG: YggS family pyridoxal phosphate-dependent enzyme [Acidimicrobiaceae bacterium]|nr:YggS family pyridoxal phosphate-dependent enzyme [Acidimicrobiaceae bacterium]